MDIDSTTGLLSYSVEYDLDKAGTASRLDCDVTISDNEYSDTAHLNITILEENDNTPVFDHEEYTFFVSTDSVVGTYVGDVHARDGDIGPHGEKIIFYN